MILAIKVLLNINGPSIVVHCHGVCFDTISLRLNCHGDFNVSLSGRIRVISNHSSDFYDKYMPPRILILLPHNISSQNTVFLKMPSLPSIVLGVTGIITGLNGASGLLSSSLASKNAEILGIATPAMHAIALGALSLGYVHSLA